MSEKCMTTEIYDIVKDNYISVKRTDRGDKIWYTMEKGSSSDGRSKSSLELSEDEFKVMASLLKEILEEEE